jgi:hypothetical protein
LIISLNPENGCSQFVPKNEVKDYDELGKG